MYQFKLLRFIKIFSTGFGQKMFPANGSSSEANKKWIAMA